MPKTGSATLLLSRRGQRYFAKTGATTLSSPGRSLPYFHCQDRGSHAFIAKTGSDAFFAAAFMRFYRNQSQRRLETRQKMPQELSVDRTIPIGISTLDNHVQRGCIRRAAPYLILSVLCNMSYTLTRYTSHFDLCSVMGYTQHTDIPLNRRCVVCNIIPHYF